MVNLVIALSAFIVQDRPQVEGDDLVIDIAKDGTYKVGERVLVDPKEPDEMKDLEDLFEGRRMVAKYQETPGKTERVKYTLHVVLASEVVFEHAQRVLQIAHHQGGVTRCVLLVAKSQDFSILKLPCDPPKRLAGDGDEQVRLIVCAEKHPQQHVLDRTKHSKSKKSSESCLVEVAGEGVGELRADESHEEVVRMNAGVIARAIKTVKDLQSQAPDSKLPRAVLLDVDEEVLARHVIRFLRALANENGGNIQIVRSPRLDKYYGPLQKGQFQREK